MLNKVELYYATNRSHQGNREAPDGYGKSPSGDGAENLRFGCVTLDNLDESKVAGYLKQQTDYGVGNGVALSDYYYSEMKNASVAAILDNLDKSRPDIDQQDRTHKLGSVKTFEALKNKMRSSCDVVIYIHGFNVSWDKAVAAAMALQTSLNISNGNTNNKDIVVVLFSWPSDGQTIPIYSYKSDRTDAEFSGSAFGRGILKFRDFLLKERTRNKDENGQPIGELLCQQEVHLLCHSMGNYVLQNTLKRMIEFNHGLRLPRLFDHIFMCSPDVDDDVLEEGNPLHRLSELARNISIYHNQGDVAMYVSDYTKQNPDRLGMNGVSRTSSLNQKIHQIDCSDIVTGRVEHSYYLNGNVNEDIRFSVMGEKQDDHKRKRIIRKNAWPNVWALK